MVQLLEALDMLHSQGVVHRALRPDSLLWYAHCGHDCSLQGVALHGQQLIRQCRMAAVNSHAPSQSSPAVPTAWGKLCWRHAGMVGMRAGVFTTWHAGPGLAQTAHWCTTYAMLRPR